MIALVLAAALFVPGPDDPVCEAGQSVQVDHCAQGQLPEETTGRAIDVPAPVPADEPAPPPVVVVQSTALPVELAETGVPVLPYGLAGVGLVCVGAHLRRVQSRR